MYLKEIVLENFKSFGNRIRIPFLPGFTVITGPNGSGKSNIIDAILFILGVRSPKMMRAGKLTDLIYKGAKEANYCKVSLIFDNSSREIPINSDEIILTRKIRMAPLPNNPDNYYSYFYINGKSASLNEFVELLSSANISPNCIVQQGDVTAIVEMGDVQRRKIIDEIAGIADFDKDIEKAKREREEVERNMDYIKIILDEIKRQLRQLKKERDEAIKYRKLLEELERKKDMLSFKKKLEIEKEIAEVQKQIESYEREKEQQERRINELRELYKQKQIKFQEIEDKLTELGGEEIFELKEKIDFYKEEIVKSKEKINYYKKEIAEKQGEITELESLLNKISKEKRQYAKKLKNIDKDLENLKKIRIAKEKELIKRKEEAEKSDEKSIELSREIAKIKKEQEEILEEIHKFGLEKDRIMQQKENLLLQINEILENKKSYEFEIKEIKWEINELAREEKKRKERKEKLEKELFEKKKEEAEISERLREIEKEIISLQRELSQLRAKEEAVLFSPATREILRLRDEGIIKGIHGTLAELGEVDEKYQKALEVAGGKRLEAIVVDDDEIAAKCIEYLKKNGYGRATFLPLNKLVMGKPRGKALLVARDAIGFAIDLIKFDKRYRAAFWYAFGDTLVVENLTKARNLMGGVRLVTLEGELIEASGAITGGSLPEKTIFGVRDANRILEINEMIRKLSNEQEILSRRLIEMKDALGKIEEELQNLPFIDLEKIEKLEIRKREIEKKLKAVNKEITKKQGEIEEIEKSLEEIEGKINMGNKKLEELSKQRKIKEEELYRIVKKEIVREIEELKKEIEELRKEEIEKEGERKAIQKEYEIVVAREEEIKGKIENNRRKIEEIKEEIRKEDGNYKENLSQLKTYEEIEKKLLAKTKDLSTERDELFKEITQLEKEIDAIATKIETAIHLISRAKARLPTLESSLAELMDIKHEFKEEELLPIEDIKREIKEIEEEIKRIEPVNMRALEEYEKQDERKRKFEEEYNKLKEQRKNLIKLEEEIKKKKIETFYRVFESINENFKKIYKELADGEGELILENPENPFEGGLMIKVRPSGKRALHLNALSGGEKSLASLAFIFALQAYEPSPFYVLDEIDMFLDEKNAEKVAKVISEKAKEAQFIVVSLRRITLKHAHHIYGVTINKGISTLIGNVNLQEVEKIVDKIR